VVARHQGLDRGLVGAACSSLCSARFGLIGSFHRILAAQYSVESTHCLGMHRRHHVAVRVEGDLDAAVAEELLDRFGVNPVGEQSAGGGVSEVVDADAGKAGLVQRPPQREPSAS